MLVRAIPLLLFLAPAALLPAQRVSLQLSPANTIPQMRSGVAQDGFEARNATLADLIHLAWGTDSDAITGGPAWAGRTRYDVSAPVPGDTLSDSVRAALRELLTMRFQLKVHDGSTDITAYAITVSGKPKLRRAVDGEHSGCDVDQTTDIGTITLGCRNINMDEFAKTLPHIRSASGYLTNDRLVDKTGLQGSWTFSFHFTPRTGLLFAPPTSSTITLSEAFRSQLGLKLAPIKVPHQILIIDQAHEPAEDPAKEPVVPQPAHHHFEVADIKPVNPNAPPRAQGMKIEPGGRITATNMTLRQLIAEAWGNINPDRIVNGPKYLDGPRWVVTAKAEMSPLAGQAVMRGVDIDEMRADLRDLLSQRFGMQAHVEDRTQDGYTLVANKPKLQPAAAGNRTGCKEGPGADGVDPRLRNPAASRLVSCRNITMKEFAEALSSWSTELRPILYVFPPVVDATGLEGRYDLTLNFTPPALAAQDTPATPADLPTADPDGTITIFEAIEQQLGLKLKSAKVSAPMLVIDHIEERPADN